MRYLLLAALMLAAGCGCVSAPSHDDLRATALRLDFERGLCSGTAIAADEILTAQHCWNMGGKLIAVNGQPVTVTGIGRDGHDTMTIRVKGVMFTHIARLGNLPKQGDRIRWFGNPQGVPDIYRQGYVARADKDSIIVDSTICRGDSGSGMFDDAGRVVAVVTGMTNDTGCTFMLAFPLAAK